MIKLGQIEMKEARRKRDEKERRSTKGRRSSKKRKPGKRENRQAREKRENRKRENHFLIIVFHLNLSPLSLKARLNRL
jgi:hypothetical protein